jgi:hypothetical protein
VPHDLPGAVSDPNVTEAEAFYYPDRGGFVGTVLAQGAWDVIALLGHVLEDLPTLTPMGVARITVDMVRPVPIGKRLEITSNVVREGKKLQVLDLGVTVGDVEHARARVLRLRDADVSGAPDLPDSSTHIDPAAALEPPEALEELPTDRGPGMMRALDLRRAGVGGGATFAYWVRLRVPVVAGEPVRVTSRQTVGVDFTNCIGAVINPGVATTINPDVSAQFLRAPAGEWVAIAGDTRFRHDVGRGISSATLSDRDGVFAVSSAAQLVQPVG